MREVLRSDHSHDEVVVPEREVWGFGLPVRDAQLPERPSEEAELLATVVCLAEADLGVLQQAAHSGAAACWSVDVVFDLEGRNGIVGVGEFTSYP